MLVTRLWLAYGVPHGFATAQIATSWVLSLERPRENLIIANLTGDRNGFVIVLNSLWMYTCNPVLLEVQSLFRFQLLIHYIQSYILWGSAVEPAFMQNKGKRCSIGSAQCCIVLDCVLLLFRMLEMFSRNLIQPQMSLYLQVKVTPAVVGQWMGINTSELRLPDDDSTAVTFALTYQQSRRRSNDTC